MSLKNFIGSNLPLFPLRQYVSIEKDGPKTYITSAMEKYLLDDQNAPGQTYTERRLWLQVNNKTSYRLYPLHKICNTLQELANSGTLNFINNQGRVFKWVKSTYYDVVPAKIIKANQLEDSKVEMWYKLPEGGLERVVASRGYLYVYLVKLGAMCYMPLDFGDTQNCSRRKKL